MRTVFETLGKLVCIMLSVGLIVFYMTEVIGMTLPSISWLKALGFWGCVSTYGMVLIWLLKS